MTLIQPVELVPASELGALHFIAAGGAGMSGIAAAYADLGMRVSGSDQADSATLDWLANCGVRTFVGHDQAHLGDADTVVVSSAVRADNVELSQAVSKGLRVWHRSAALGALMLGKTGIAVSGTHGKTTTSAMIAVMLAELGADPSFVLGAPLAGGTSSQLGGGEYFVVEADESDGSFWQYPAQIAVITNIEADHLDNWGNAQAYADGFAKFASAALVSDVVVSGDDPGAAALVGGLVAAGKRVWVFEVGPAGLAVTRADGGQGPAPVGVIARPNLKVPGEHNLRNAAAALAVGLLLGYDPQRIIRGLEGFRGTARRFETVARVAGVWIVDDYAHHPTEVRATLEAARTLADGRIVACFQPHLFTRTRDFAADFGRALALADLVLVMNVYPAREDPIPGVSGKLVADAAGEVGALVSYLDSPPGAGIGQAAQALAEVAREPDLVLTLGAGNVTAVGPALAQLLGAGSTPPTRPGSHA
ncbi:MAG: UDP-N-acetylmuramate--L-alanine ligase [Propionibacteriaceae bacterium]|jgi:UDP-N-acetylmuramate--alanine ligase|nr:UDP-N-acetylmuramate--L-alanine ligase [Propionibacteriaceae bacterium]